MNKQDAINAALASWHGGDNITNAIAKLAGETGETLDLVAKHIYKPDFNYLTCICGNPRIHPIHSDMIPVNDTACGGTYRSKLEDEMGDISYYIRIVEHLLDKGVDTDAPSDLFKAMITVNYYAGILAYFGIVVASDPLHPEFMKAAPIIDNALSDLKRAFVELVMYSPWRWDEIIQSNFIKLNSEETQHGWKK